MEQINLPEPKHEGTLSVESALFKRRSIREYTKVKEVMKMKAEEHPLCIMPVGRK